MRLYRDRAVVLRQHKLGEADRIVTLLTRDHGLVRAVAKGVRRTRSKFGARLEPFAHIDAQLHPGRNLDIVTQVVSIDAFATDIVSDYGRYTCGCAMLETAERLAGEERAPAPALHRLTVERAAGGGRRPPVPRPAAGRLSAARHGHRRMGAGADRVRPLRHPGPHRAFHIAAGGSVCPHCRPAGSTTPPPGVLDLMSALHDGDWEFAEQAPAVAPQLRQRIGGRAPAMASGTAAQNVAAGGADVPRRPHHRRTARSADSGRIWAVAKTGPTGQGRTSQPRLPAAAPRARRLPDLPRQVDVAGRLPGAAAVRPTVARAGRRSTSRKRPRPGSRPTGCPITSPS